MKLPFDQLVGLSVRHADGAYGKVVGVAPDARLHVRFADGACTTQLVRNLSVGELPLLAFLVKERIGLDPRLPDQELDALASDSRLWGGEQSRGSVEETLSQVRRHRQEMALAEQQEQEAGARRLQRLKEARMLREQQAREEEIRRCRQRAAEAAREERRRQEEAERRAGEMRAERERKAVYERRQAELREQRRRRAEVKRQSLRSQLRDQLEENFLEADSWFDSVAAKVLPRQDLEAEKIGFIQDWMEKNSPPDKQGVRRRPADEQAAAIAAINGHVQVIARAGSGKTTTLVNRALFLLNHCKVPASTMLLLAFNRKAVVEIRKRLLIALSTTAGKALEAEMKRRQRARRRLPKTRELEVESAAVDSVATELDVTLPHILTFHALAYALVHPEEGLLFDGADADEGQALSRTVQEVIDDHLREPAHRNRIRQVMMAHFKEDWERIIRGGYDKSLDELLPFRRSLPRQSLRGEYVKSFGEKVIADFLFEHDVEYKYERNHWWSGVNYRPDFTVFKGAKTGIILEYFGLAGDPDYDKMSEAKRTYWRDKPLWELLTFSPHDITESDVDAFRQRLRAQLEERGVRCRLLSEDDIWARIKDRAIDRFTRAMVGFIGRCRKRVLSSDDLSKIIHDFSDASPVELQFLEIAQIIYRAYLDRLQTTDEEDFDGLMQRAADSVANGRTVFLRRDRRGDVAVLRYVFIDEYQDFSYLFHRLISAIRDHNPQVEFFCVGDDWQAINGFAGSDLTYFRNFQQHFPAPKRLNLSTNYRSACRIVEIGNALMKGLGEPARVHKSARGEISVADLNTFKPSALELQQLPGDLITPAVARLVTRGLAEGLDVVLLARRNGLPWFVNWQDVSGTRASELEMFLAMVRNHFPDETKRRITISTTHKYKGLEKPMVIALDVVVRSYPLIHPDWVFNRALGDSVEGVVEEERRLLYVALTRAVERLVIITDGKDRSPFLEELEGWFGVPAINWDEYPAPRGERRRLAVKVGNPENHSGAGTFPIKDLLKAAGYQWRSTGWRAWEKGFPADGFAIEALEKEKWTQDADGVEVRICDEADSVVALYLVNGGRWTCVMSELARFARSGSEPTARAGGE